ncbi:hypothetical protein WA556_005199 [Blastocystis sp. ATCC 50177/Nand II]
MFRCTGSFLKLWIKGQKTVYKRTSFRGNLWGSFSHAEGDVTRSAVTAYKACLRKNSSLYISTVGSYAKTKYKLQNAWDHLVHGKKEKAAAQVAFMITQDMKQSLADLGFSKKDMANLKPAYAQLIVTKNISYASWLATKDVLIKEYEEEEAKRRADTLKKAKEEAAAAAAAAEKESEASQTSEAAADEAQASSQLVVVPADSEEDSGEKPIQSPSLMVVPSDSKEESV